jgi:F-type H+-transporting ATPase subunit c
MKRKLIGAAGMLMLLGSPIFAQTPAGGGGTDLHLPFAYLAVGIASGLCGLGQGKVAAASAEAMARNPGAAAGIRLALLLGLAFIESLALYALFVTFIAR